MGSDVLLVGLTDDLEGSSSGIGDVRDRVPVQGWPMGDRADLPNRDLWGPPLGKPFLKCCIIAKSDEGTGAASWRDDGSSACTGSQRRGCGSRIQSKGRDRNTKTSEEKKQQIKRDHTGKERDEGGRVMGTF